MGSTLNRSLTDDLRAFVDEHCGDGTQYATPSEFVCDLLRQRKLHIESEKACEAIIAGYHDAIEGRLVEYKGDLMTLLEKPLE